MLTPFLVMRRQQYTYVYVPANDKNYSDHETKGRTTRDGLPVPGTGRPRGRPYPVRRGRILLCPIERAFYGLLPAFIEAVPLIRAHLWLKGAVDSPVLCDFLRAAPETYGDAREVGGAEGGGLRHLWSLNSDAQNVSLELHKQVIDDRAAIDA